MFFLRAGYHISIVYTFKVSKVRKNDVMARLMLFLATTFITSGLSRMIMVTIVVISIYT